MVGGFFMNNEIGEKFLPIGTVVMLKGGTKRAMITGFCSVAQDDSQKTYDYSGCLYPEGFISSNQICLFDHEQIERVYFLGYVDDEETAFQLKLKSLVEQNNMNTIPVGQVGAVSSPDMAPVDAASMPADTMPVSPVSEMPSVEPVMPEMPPVDVAPMPADTMPMSPVSEIPEPIDLPNNDNQNMQ